MYQLIDLIGFHKYLSLLLWLMENFTTEVKIKKKDQH